MKLPLLNYDVLATAARQPSIRAGRLGAAVWALGRLGAEDVLAPPFGRDRLGVIALNV